MALKRKKEYKNTHSHQLINPEKLFKMLEKLKRNKNPYYQFYEDYNEYQARCRTSDPTGYNVVFQDDDKTDEIVDIDDKTECIVNDALSIDDDSGIEDGACEEEEEEKEINTKDPVKRYQFKYNESLYMTNKYPEISVNTEASVSIAPGEGQI